MLLIPKHTFLKLGSTAEQTFLHIAGKSRECVHDYLFTTRLSLDLFFVPWFVSEGTLQNSSVNLSCVCVFEESAVSEC